jgi:hypothetical protein
MSSEREFSIIHNDPFHLLPLSAVEQKMETGEQILAYRKVRRATRLMAVMGKRQDIRQAKSNRTTGAK